MLVGGERGTSSSPSEARLRVLGAPARHCCCCLVPRWPPSTTRRPHRPKRACVHAGTASSTSPYIVSAQQPVAQRLDASWRLLRLRKQRRKARLPSSGEHGEWNATPGIDQMMLVLFINTSLQLPQETTQTTEFKQSQAISDLLRQPPSLRSSSIPLLLLLPSSNAPSPAVPQPPPSSQVTPTSTSSFSPRPSSDYPSLSPPLPSPPSPDQEP